jgi:hypothetical protein
MKTEEDELRRGESKAVGKTAPHPLPLPVGGRGIIVHHLSYTILNLTDSTRLTLPPTKVEYEPLIRADDFGLKETIKV